MEREALKQALEAQSYAAACLLNQLSTKDKHAYAVEKLSASTVAIKEALEQPAQEPTQLAHIAQFMKELRPAIGPMATMGKSKTTQEWFDIVINEIELLQATQEKNT